MAFKIDSLLHTVKDILAGASVSVDVLGRFTISLPRPALCGVCGKDCGFVREGFYDRTVATLFKIITIRIQSYECRSKRDKRHSFSVLPPFCSDTVPTLWIFIRRYCCFQLAMV